MGRGWRRLVRTPTRRGSTGSVTLYWVQNKLTSDFVSFQTNPGFSSSGEWVTYSDSTTYFFSPELSEGTEEDVIVMPNIPLFGAFRKLGGSGILEYTSREVFKGIFNSKEGIDKTPFLTLSVGEFLWGYPSILMTMDEDWGGNGGSTEKKEERTRRGEESESEDMVGFELNEVDKEAKRLERKQQWADFDQSFGDDFVSLLGRMHPVIHQFRSIECLAAQQRKHIDVVFTR